MRRLAATTVIALVAATTGCASGGTADSTARQATDRPATVAAASTAPTEREYLAALGRICERSAIDAKPFSSETDRLMKAADTAENRAELAGKLRDAAKHFGRVHAEMLTVDGPSATIKRAAPFLAEWGRRSSDLERLAVAIAANDVDGVQRAGAEIEKRGEVRRTAAATLGADDCA